MDNEQLFRALSDMMDKKLDEKLQPINNRLDKIEFEISSLNVGQRELKKELRETKDKVNATYELALDAWGQSTENRVWLENSTLKA